ncbi:MAG: type II toxin-antitoxin system RelE/ParE family toxin [Deltaproteobacteria bacterium]
MIKSFKDKETEKVYTREGSKKLPYDIRQTALRKLRMVNNAKDLNDLTIPPANRLEKLKGRRSGQHSIRINDKWRVCFVWKKSDAYNVEITEYH